MRGGARTVCVRESRWGWESGNAGKGCRNGVNRGGEGYILGGEERQMLLWGLSRWRGRGPVVGGGLSARYRLRGVNSSGLPAANHSSSRRMAVGADNARISTFSAAVHIYRKHAYSATCGQWHPGLGHPWVRARAIALCAPCDHHSLSRSETTNHQTSPTRRTLCHPHQ